MKFKNASSCNAFEWCLNGILIVGVVASVGYGAVQIGNLPMLGVAYLLLRRIRGTVSCGELALPASSLQRFFVL